MDNGNTQKIKLLKMFELISQETDAAHPMSQSELCLRMEAMGIPCAQRTVIRDICVLNDFGYGIQLCRIGHQRGYYVEHKTFSVAELKLLTDAVQAAGFISVQKTNDLIQKIAELGGSYRSDLLLGSRVLFNTRKCSNEAIFENIEKTEEALRQNRKVSFCYFDLDENANRVYRHDCKRYCVEPLALVYDNGYYYLLCLNNDKSKQGDTVAYRLDRMDETVVLIGKISAAACALRGKMEGYTNRVYRMFGGPEKEVKLIFDNSVLGAVYDRFGEQIKVKRLDENTLTTTVRAQISPTFRGWVYQFGEKMKIIGDD